MSSVLVAARPKELQGWAFDAFSTRHRALVQSMLGEHEVHVVQLAGAVDDVGTTGLTGVSSVHSLSITRAPSGRHRRALHMLAGVREPKLLGWEYELMALAKATGARAAITFGPWLGEEYRVIHRTLPSMHLFEEDLSQMRELAPQSAQARLLRAASRWALGHRADQPRVVAAISTPEQRRAAATYPKATSVVLPLTLDEALWPIADSPSEGRTVLVVGVLSEERNAEGLAAVLDSVRRRKLGDRLRFRVVTRSGVHPVLEDYLADPWVDAGPERGSIREEYRRARCALVPALRATGMKTTILQAWSAGCPVVCSSVCAAGVDEQAQRALMSAATADGMVDKLLQVAESSERRKELAEAGFRRLRTDFDRADVDARFLSLLRALVA